MMTLMDSLALIGAGAIGGAIGGFTIARLYLPQGRHRRRRFRRADAEEDETDD